jgi:formate dehydrogenase subunit gamma
VPHPFLDDARRGMATSANRHGKILRFRSSERLLHWAIAVPFLVCAASALVLLVLSQDEQPGALRDTVARVHWISGLLLIVLPLLAVLVHWRDLGVHLRNFREAWLWSSEDFRWLGLALLAALGRKVELPEAGKFNAGEKLNFILSSFATLVLCATGLAIAAPDDAIVPWLVHVFAAIVTAPVVLGHIFLATIQPSTRPGLMGMITGLVERRWAKHHYRRWYREEHGGGEGAPPLPRGPLQSMLRAAGAVSPGVLMLLGLALAVAGFIGNFVPLPGSR